MSTAVDVNQVEDQLLDTYEQLVERTSQAGETLKNFIDQNREIRKAESKIQEQLMQLMGGSAIQSPPAPSAPSKRASSKTGAKKRGRPKKGTKAATKSSTGKKRDGYQNDKSLATVIMEVLGRSENKSGLNIAAIRDVIEGEKLWLTDKDLSKQVQTNLQSLKGRKKIVRDAEKKVYFIPA